MAASRGEVAHPDERQGRPRGDASSHRKRMKDSRQQEDAPTDIEMTGQYGHIVDTAAEVKGEASNGRKFPWQKNCRRWKLRTGRATKPAFKAVKRDDRRTAILAVAREVFFEHGYADASMSMIAARLGGSKGHALQLLREQEGAVHRLHRGHLPALRRGDLRRVARRWPVAARPEVAVAALHRIFRAREHRPNLPAGRGRSASALRSLPRSSTKRAGQWPSPIGGKARCRPCAGPESIRPIRRWRRGTSSPCARAASITNDC